MRVIGLAVLLSIGGCVNADTVYLANGVKVVRITCTLRTDALTPCYKTAGDICGPRGYTIYDWDGQPWSTPYPAPTRWITWAP